MSTVRNNLFLALALLFGVGCERTAQVDRVEWPTMGTIAALSFRGSVSNYQDVVRGSFAAVASKLNAWDAKSELSQIKTTNDYEKVVSAEVLPCYQAAFKLMVESKGAFNPLLASELRKRGQTRHSALIDLGAIAKGFAVDCAYERIAAEGPDVLIDLGGNLRACGGHWKTGVQNPFGSGFAATIELQKGEALATSATYARGKHILDGRTGEVVTNEVASVTVLAPTAMEADGLSTTLFVLGAKEGIEFLKNHYPFCEAFFILMDGSFITYPKESRFAF